MHSAIHIPVMLRESVSHLITDRGGNYIDATFGRGGHLKEILASISDRGSVYAFDRDPASKDQFEKTFTNTIKTNYSLMVNSGSSANLLTLLALKIFYGTGEVIEPPLTWISDVASVIQNGFKPVFADINPKTLCMDEDEIIKKINSKTKAIIINFLH